MRVYLNNTKPREIQLHEIIKTRCVYETQNYISEVFSPEGLFIVEHDGIFRMNIRDGDIVRTEHLTIDNSIAERTRTTSLPYDHFTNRVKQYIYRYQTVVKLKKPIKFD
jgi:hypothetical protein